MKISIVTVTYNSAKTLADTIDSVLAQNYLDLEYIIVDGLSSDATVDIIKSYVPKFGDRLKWISEKDKGLYDAMNKGIKMATGDVVGIINSDDFYNSANTISLVAQHFMKKQIDVVFGDIQFVKPDNLDKVVRYYSSKNFNPRYFRYGFCPAHPTFFVYKKFFDQFGYYRTDFKIAADFDLMLRFLFKGRLSYSYIPICFITMRLGGVSTASFSTRLLTNKEIMRSCKDNGLSTNYCYLFLKSFSKLMQYLNIKKNENTNNRN